MATWQAEIKVTSSGSYFPVTVEAGASYAAKETIQHIYNPITIRNLHQVSRTTSSSSGDSDSSGNGTVALIGFIAIAWVFFSFTPWILMGLGGAFGTWIGQIVTQQTLEEYTEREDNSGQAKAVFTVLLALFLGGFGFVKGTEIKADFDKPTNSSPAKVQQAK
jgi:hypothetical protein